MQGHVYKNNFAVPQVSIKLLLLKTFYQVIQLIFFLFLAYIFLQISTGKLFLWYLDSKQNCISIYMYMYTHLKL